MTALKQGEISSMKLSGREKWAIISSVSIIVFILYFFYFYQPITAETSNIIARLSAIERDVKNRRTLDSELKRLSNELASLYDELDFLYTGSFEGISQAEIILFLENLISHSAIKKIIRFGETDDYGTYKVAKVILNMDTNYSNLKRIIQGIEQAPWKNRIEQMRIVIKDKEDSNSQNYNIESEITIGFYCP